MSQSWIRHVLKESFLRPSRNAAAFVECHSFSLLCETHGRCSIFSANYFSKPNANVTVNEDLRTKKKKLKINKYLNSSISSIIKLWRFVTVAWARFQQLRRVSVQDAPYKCYTYGFSIGINKTNGFVLKRHTNVHSIITRTRIRLIINLCTKECMELCVLIRIIIIYCGTSVEWKKKKKTNKICII